MSVPSSPSPVPVLLVLGVLITVLTALGMRAADLHIIMMELVGLATGFALGRAQQPPAPGA